MIVLARHGESEYSARGLLNGDAAVAVALTMLGREQARALGEALRDEAIGLCVTSELQRAKETADEALAGRGVPRIVMPALNDPLYGIYEGKHLDDYRAWAAAEPSASEPRGGGESRGAIVERYARAFGEIAERPEDEILVVSHSLPVAYALGAKDGVPPGPRVPLAELAHPYRFTKEELQRAAEFLGNWAKSPTW